MIWQVHLSRDVLSNTILDRGLGVFPSYSTFTKQAGYALAPSECSEVTWVDHLLMCPIQRGVD